MNKEKKYIIVVRTKFTTYVRINTNKDGYCWGFFYPAINEHMWKFFSTYEEAELDRRNLYKIYENNSIFQNISIEEYK